MPGTRPRIILMLKICAPPILEEEEEVVQSRCGFLLRLFLFKKKVSLFFPPLFSFWRAEVFTFLSFFRRDWIYLTFPLNLEIEKWLYFWENFSCVLNIFEYRIIFLNFFYIFNHTWASIWYNKTLLQSFQEIRRWTIYRGFRPAQVKIEFLSNVFFYTSFTSMGKFDGISKLFLN